MRPCAICGRPCYAGGYLCPGCHGARARLDDEPIQDHGIDTRRVKFDLSAGWQFVADNPGCEKSALVRFLGSRARGYDSVLMAFEDRGLLLAELDDRLWVMA